ncbi:hypothetical protein DFH08DRAFT_945748 [Mycena albidolilacea]|uniref:Uncharacterized protein n=1 Tax=Mycena albidolilacea TaxID=1033008 RepID=A0AAD6Z0D2_9AGAR|nr:hypothetical protein DFH08DRAFT_945748 [Mycena albidolilacea]
MPPVMSRLTAQPSKPRRFCRRQEPVCCANVNCSITGDMGIVEPIVKEVLGVVYFERGGRSSLNRNSRSSAIDEGRDVLIKGMLRYVTVVLHLKCTRSLRGDGARVSRDKTAMSSVDRNRSSDRLKPSIPSGMLRRNLDLESSSIGFGEAIRLARVLATWGKTEKMRLATAPDRGVWRESSNLWVHERPEIWTVVREDGECGEGDSWIIVRSCCNATAVVMGETEKVTGDSIGDTAMVILRERKAIGWMAVIAQRKKKSMNANLYMWLTLMSTVPVTFLFENCYSEFRKAQKSRGTEAVHVDENAGPKEEAVQMDLSG